MIKWFERNYLFSLFIALILAILIFYVSSRESFNISSGPESWVANAYHFCVFFFFAAFLIMGCVKGKKIKWMIFGVLFSIFYAVSDEFHQLFVPGRFSSLGDVLIDFSGIFLATLVYIAILYSRD